ncbi:TPA: hypothetical protein ACVU5Q_003656 [Vibrio parahaemolyticus]
MTNSSTVRVEGVMFTESRNSQEYELMIAVTVLLILREEPYEPFPPFNNKKARHEDGLKLSFYRGSQLSEQLS